MTEQQLIDYQAKYGELPEEVAEIRAAERSGIQDDTLAESLRHIVISWWSEWKARASEDERPPAQWRIVLAWLEGRGLKFNLVLGQFESPGWRCPT